MKKTILVTALVLTVVTVGMIACNSATGVSKNKEGITEITGPAEQNIPGQHPIRSFTTMGWDTTGRH